MCGVFGVYALATTSRGSRSSASSRSSTAARSPRASPSPRRAPRRRCAIGLVAQVFDEQKLAACAARSRSATPATRRPARRWENAAASPARRARTVALGHNGNSSTSASCARSWRGRCPAGTTSDSELVAALLANEAARSRRPRRMRCAGSRRLLHRRALGGTPGGVRDAHGFRPLVIGQLHDDWVVASATCALDRRRGVRARGRARRARHRRRERPPTTGAQQPECGALCISEYCYSASRTASSRGRGARRAGADGRAPRPGVAGRRRPRPPVPDSGHRPRSVSPARSGSRSVRG